MSTPYLGEIRLFAGNFAPFGWAFCSGQLLAISQNDALFALIGTTYGGDGQTTFALPNMQSRVPIHQGTNSANGINYTIGTLSGEEQVTISTSTLGSHTHPVLGATTAAATTNPTGSVPAGAEIAVYGTGLATAMQSGTLTASASSGGGLPHPNIMPYQCINFIIALQGVFPTRN